MISLIDAFGDRPPIRWTKRERECARRKRELPYGIWVDGKGREVLFNRTYRAIWERHLDGCIVEANPGEWVKWKTQAWFYNDNTSPNHIDKRGNAAAKRCEQILSDFLAGKSIDRYIVDGPGT